MAPLFRSSSRSSLAFFSAAAFSSSLAFFSASSSLSFAASAATVAATPSWPVLASLSAASVVGRLGESVAAEVEKTTSLTPSCDTDPSIAAAATVSAIPDWAALATAGTANPAAPTAATRADAAPTVPQRPRTLFELVIATSHFAVRCG